MTPRFRCLLVSCHVMILFLLASVARAAPTSPLDSDLRDTVWTDDHGKSVSLAEFRQAPLVVTAFYCSCKKICPQKTLKTLRQLQQRLDRERVSANMVLVTLDPEHDTPAALARYRTSQGLTRENWHLLRGSAHDVEALSRAFGLGSSYETDGHVFHDFVIALLWPSGRVSKLDWDHDDVAKLDFTP